MARWLHLTEYPGLSTSGVLRRFPDLLYCAHYERVIIKLLEPGGIQAASGTDHNHLQGSNRYTVPEAASESLDLIRAIAACTVMVGHVRALFFVDSAQLKSRSVPLQALYFFTGFGH